MSMVGADVGGNMARRRKPPRALDPVAAEFGKRLTRIIAEQGYNQAEFARHASKFMPKDSPFRRDSISLYTRGIQLPGPVRLAALCKALKVQEHDLIAEGATMSPNAPTLAITPQADGSTWLQINQSVPQDLALKIAALLGSHRGSK